MPVHATISLQPPSAHVKPATVLARSTSGTHVITPSLTAAEVFPASVTAVSAIDTPFSWEWSDVAVGQDRLPTITIGQQIYPDASGVQFWYNGQIDERHAARPNGYDATGPNEGSTYHMYPSLTLATGDVVEARWLDTLGTSHVSTENIAGGVSIAPLTIGATSEIPRITTPWVNVMPTTVSAVGQVPAPSSAFPDETNTGPSITEGEMAAYTGPATIIAADTTIENTVVGTSSVPQNLHNQARNLTIRNCIIYGKIYNNPNIDTGGGLPPTLLIEDSEINVPITDSGATGLDKSNITARRVRIRGGRRSLAGTNNVLAEDCLFHEQFIPADKAWHGSGARAFQNVTLRHCTIAADHADTATGGPSACLTIYNDGDPYNVLIEKCLFKDTLAIYAAYGGSLASKSGTASYIRFIDNVWEAGTSPINGFDPNAVGNEWTNNRWESGELIEV